MHPRILSAGVVVVRFLNDVQGRTSAARGGMPGAASEPKYLLLRAFNYWDFRVRRSSIYRDGTSQSPSRTRNRRVGLLRRPRPPCGPATAPAHNGLTPREARLPRTTRPRFALPGAQRPKGQLDPGEEPLAAAIREVEEETTLTNLDFRWGHVFQETEPYGNKHKIARYYIAESRDGEVHLPVSAELGHPEHDEFRWMSYDEAKELLVSRVQAILDWAHRIASGDNP